MEPDPMPPHHGGQHAMTMPLLPQWLSVAWALVLLGVVGLHVWHSYTRTGQHRWWHLAHTVMALGMIGMYLLPVMTDPGLARAGLLCFAAGTVLLFACTATLGRREGGLNPVWLVTGLDMMVMTYMFLPGSARPAALTWIAVTYLVGQVGAWLANLWARPRRGVAVPDAPETQAAVATAQGPGAATAAAPRRQFGLSGCAALDVRITLAIMAASMAYMLAAMGLGMS